MFVPAAVFVGVFAVTVFVLGFDFDGSLARSEERFRFLKSVDQIAEEYYGIPPYWLQRYGISLREESDIQADGDGDSLSLAEEYRYFTNPLVKDTDSDGFDDGKEVRDGYNPTGEGRLDMNRNGLPDDWEAGSGLPTDRDTSGEDPDQDGLTNREEYAYGTGPAVADTDSDGFGDGAEVANGYDPSEPGTARPAVEILVEKIGIVAPVVLASDASEVALEKDLEQGVVHYPKTALPGQSGNVFVTGHSSNYSWAGGKYNFIFRRLGDLSEGDVVLFRLIHANGKTVEHSYRVGQAFVAAPDDPRIFEETDESVLTLATCWPLNTSWKRLVVKADLVS